MMQRLTVATFAGEAAAFLAERFDQWRSVPAPDAVDRFSDAVRERSLHPPIVYFTEWVDRWLMGDQVPGPDAVHGRRFQASRMTPTEAIAWADRCGGQFQEQKWLAARLREAAAGCGTVVDPYAVVVLREVLGASTDDDEVRAASASVPDWLRACLEGS